MANGKIYLVALLLVAAAMPVLGATLSTQIREGVYKEQVEGDLDAAITIYEGIITAHADNQRYAAQATYRLGLCYLKKGQKNKAIEQFERIISDYPSQKIVSRKSKAQLKKLKPVKNITSNKPTVIQSFPTTYSNDVSVDVNKLTVTFDQPMIKGNFSWVKWNYKFPETPGKPSYDEKGTTCSLPVKLEPGTAYLVRINAKQYSSFMNLKGVQAQPFVLVFATKDKNDKPTPIPEDMLKFAKFINKSSEVSSAKTGSKVSIFSKIDIQVTRFIGEQFGTIALEASKQHLPINSHIYYVDKNGTLYSGGMNSFYNWTGRTIKDKTGFGRTSNPKQTHYAVDGQKLNVEIVPHETMPNKWQIYWTPDQPLEPGESLYYGWSMDDSHKLPEQSNGTYKLKMKNYPGTSIVETFFLVLPKDLHISQSNKPTQSTELLNYNVFWWTKTVKQGEKHIEDVSIAKSNSKTNKLAGENLAAEGWKLWGQRKFAESEEKFKEAANLDPANDNALQGLGWAQLNQGKRQNATDSFEKCIKLNAKNSAALNGLGWIAHGDDKTDKAVEWWEKAFEAAPSATASLNGLTQVYMEKKDYEKAVKYYKMWLKVEPNNKQAKDGLDKAQLLLRDDPANKSRG